VSVPWKSALTAPDGIEIGWEEVGEGRPLLLVHPGVADARAWGFVRQHLPDGLRVAAMDRRGRGRSGRADDVPYTLEVEADDVLAVAEALGGSVVVVAHSIAATITLQALRRQTGVIVGAVLYEPPLPGMPAGLESSDAMNAALQEDKYEEALDAFLRDLVKLSPADVQAYQTSPLRPTQLALIWTMSREVSSLYALDADIDRYASIEVPVQLLVGDRTALHHRQAVDALAQVLPSAQVTVLEGQGHGALVQAPQLVADAIIDFVDQLPPD
jgi:pimeloyl-ACP methyl ester carboxylesterase